MESENANPQETTKTPAELAKEALAKRMTGKSGKGGGNKVNNTAIEAAKKEASKKKKSSSKNNFVKGAKDSAFCPMTSATTQ